MKASHLFASLFLSAVSFAVAGEWQRVALADCPAIVQTRFKENEERLKVSITAPISKFQAQDAEYYWAWMVSVDGNKLWGIRVLADGKVLEVVEKKQPSAKEKLVALHDSFRKWFGSVTGW